MYVVMYVSLHYVCGHVCLCTMYVVTYVYALCMWSRMSMHYVCGHVCLCTMYVVTYVYALCMWSRMSLHYVHMYVGMSLCDDISTSLSCMCWGCRSHLCGLRPTLQRSCCRFSFDMTRRLYIYKTNNII